MNFLWLALVASLLSGVAPAPVDTHGYIIIGDSRTVGMVAACDVDSHANVFVVAKTGQGSYWLRHEALAEVEHIKKANTDIDAWTIVSNLGVNDLMCADEYIELYDSLDDEFIFVSVNPVRRYGEVTNAKVDAFNEKMRCSGYPYIDTNLLCRIEGFSTVDGLHYTDKTYRMIWSFLVRELGII